MAEDDAREIRVSGTEDAVTLYRRMEALEGPLNELLTALRQELDSLHSEFRSRGAIAAQPPEEGTPAPEEGVSPSSQATAASRQAEEVEMPEAAEAEVAEVEEAPSPPPEPPSPQEEDLPPGEVARPPEEGTPAPEEVFSPPPQETVASRQAEEAPASEGWQADDQAETVEGAPVKRGMRGLLRRKRPFVTTPGNCAVCHRSIAAGSQQALEASGWVVRGDLGICPQCRSDGWQLPEGARLPHRRAGG